VIRLDSQYSLGLIIFKIRRMEIISYNILKLILNTLQIVGYPYYKVPTTDNKNKLQNRERVFCYELYHEMI